MANDDPDAITLSDASMFSSHRDGDPVVRIRAMTTKLTLLGYGYMRMTRIAGGIWMEAWTNPPRNQGEFNAAHAMKVRIEK